jgi:DHA3 family macrolide efflux protein-like MFS transporter
MGLGIPFNFWVYIGFWAFVGFFIALSSPLLVALIQEKVDPLYIGRIFSVFGLIHTISLPLGMLVFGPLSDVMNVSDIIFFSGVIMVVLAVSVLFKKSLIKEGIKIEKPVTMSEEPVNA